MKAPYHQDNYRTIYHGDCRSMAELPDESVHCVVTSSPYWGLRKYAGQQELVWGGDKDCQHQWNTVLKHRSAGGPQVPQSKWQSNISIVEAQRDTKSNFCSLCGAWRGAFGLEPMPEMYIQHTIEILREIRRVLRKDGVVFWNIGDSYASGKGTCFNPGGGKGSFSTHGDRKDSGVYPLDRGNVSMLKAAGLKPLDLCLIPFRLAIAAQEDGWWVRSDIIWNKPNPMPESVNGWRWERHKVKVKKGVEDWRVAGRKRGGVVEEAVDHVSGGNTGFTNPAEWQDCPGCPKCSPNDGYVLRKGSWRPTETHEYILMLTKTDEYYCDAEAVREPSECLNESSVSYRASGKSDSRQKHINGIKPAFGDKGFWQPNPSGRNLRSVWTFPTAPYPGAHFATFPERLPEICIKAATPEVGVCAKCGAPWVRIVEMEHSYQSGSGQSGRKPEGKWSNGEQEQGDLEDDIRAGPCVATKTLGWKPSCKCGTEDKVAAIVLDPFMGSGTTLLVAVKLGRRAVGYDISEEYCRLALERNKQIGLV